MSKNMKYYLRYYWNFIFNHTRKNSHAAFFIKNGIKSMMPRWWFRLQLNHRLNRFYKLAAEEQRYIKERVDYYCKFLDNITLPEDAPCIGNFVYRKRESYIHDYVNSTYFFDAYEYIRYFPQNLRWAYNPGDINYLFPLPELTKSRPISTGNENRNNILLNLDKVRHFTWVNDPYTWEQKECKIIFRGDTTGKTRRLAFISLWKDHPLCDLVSTSDDEYKDKQMPIYEHLRYKYIMTLEGNDVASNLKWVMSSNSIAVMPRPIYETWYMEGKLIPDYHYIEIADDYSDLIDKTEYYETHPFEAAAIIKHAHEWVAQFRNSRREDLISLMVLDKYFKLTRQKVDKRTSGRADRAAQQQKRLFINEIVKLANYDQVNAQGKARKDVLHTCKDAGYEEVDIINYKYSLGEGKRYHHYPLLSHYWSVIQAKKIARRIKFGDIVVIQDFYRKHMQVLAKEALRREAKVIFIVHDVQTIRYNSINKEIRKLNNASMLFVHTEAMAKKLKEMGVIIPMHIMWLFDYYADDPMLSVKEVMQHKHDIVFAGNLTKSTFLPQLVAYDSPTDMHFKLYGIHDNTSDLSGTAHIEYAGIFEPEHTGSIIGGWGLVWDGDSIDTCSGDMGEYLRYNSSHKTSLYLAAGIPIIVWSQSSLAEWVKEHHIGIIVDNLKAIDSAIANISDREYTEIIDNAREVGTKLRQGEFLKTNITKL